MHERELIFRDVKGNNILIRNNGVLAFTDFGITSQENVKHLHTPNLMTKDFAPKEVSTNCYSYPIDIYCAGITLIQIILGGSAPTLSYIDDIKRKVANPNVKFEDEQERLLNKFRDVLRYSLAKDPNERKIL